MHIMNDCLDAQPDPSLRWRTCKLQEYRMIANSHLNVLRVLAVDCTFYGYFQSLFRKTK